jgi:hypothetical protein
VTWLGEPSFLYVNCPQGSFYRRPHLGLAAGESLLQTGSVASELMVCSGSVPGSGHHSHRGDQSASLVASISADCGKSSVLDLSNPLGFDAETSSNLAQCVALFVL